MNSFLKGFLYFLVFAALLSAAVFGARFAQNYFTSAGASSAPSNVNISEITQTSVKIIWQTEKETQGTVIYGENPDNLPLMSFENEAIKNHEVNLSLLNPATSYYFKIKIADEEFDNDGLPWQFTTSASVSAPASPDFDPNKFEEKFGSTDPLYDLNHDGIVNAVDFDLYLKSQ